MPDRFPEKKKGESLGHEHVNALSDAARRIEGSKPGSFLLGRRGGSIHGESGFAPWQQFAFLVTSDEGSGLYKGKVRWYSHSSEEWQEHDKEWDMDANGLDLSPSVTISWSDFGMLNGARSYPFVERRTRCLINFPKRNQVIRYLISTSMP